MRLQRFACLFFLLFLFVFPGAQAAGKEKIGLNDILAALDSQPLDLEAQARLRAQAQATIADDGSDQTQLARRYWDRARANAALGLVMQQVADMRKAVELGGAGNAGRAWRELGQAEFLAGNLQAAIAARLKAAAMTPDSSRGRLISEYAGLADLYRRLGDFETARRYVRDAEGLLVILRSGRGWLDFQYNWQTTVEDALGRVEFASGHYVEAEARFRKALEYIELALPINSRHVAEGRDVAPQAQMELYRDGLEAWLASCLWKQGKMFEAEIHARNAAYNSIRRAGQDSIQANANMQQLILVLSEQDRLEPALKLVDRIKQTFQRQGLPANAFFVARNQRLRANILTGLGRWREALDEFEANRQALAASPELAASLGGPSLGWIRALMAVGDKAAAVDMANTLYSRTRKELGPLAYETLEAQGYLAAALARQGELAKSLPHFREAIAVLAPQAAAQTDRSSRRFKRLSFIIESYLNVLAETRRQTADAKQAQSLLDEAFAVADALRGQSVQQAMAASAARAAATTPELANLVRQEQDARQERNALNAIQADLMSRRADQVPPAILADMRQRVAVLDGRLKTLTEDIRRRFPDYAELLTPRPATVAGIRAVLKPGESLLSILSAEEQTYVWAIPAHGESSFAATEGGRQSVDRAVATLRAALDPGDVELGRLPQFDPQVAHALYKQLLEPVKAGWQGANHLIVAAGGALGRLPLSVLLTEPTAAAKSTLAFADYASWPWLIKKMAISQLPAANSLPTLRRMKPGGVNRLALAGFGDPDFGGKLAPAATRRLRSTIRNTSPSSGESSLFDYSRIPALPDTRDEIMALAGALKAKPERDIFLGKAASKSAVMSADLSDRRVVAFATHGLLAGEYPGVEQPALALANPGGGEHGLLTLDDILSLKLDADWVILSACNTSAGDGQGGEAISGLGRGFFYAGTRALLVTHWPVETVSAKQLVVGIFQALTATPGLARAQALQQSMLKVMAEQGQDEAFRFSYAHPMFWAPYALVGDGGM